MLTVAGLRCRTQAVAMDSLPTNDTNGPVLRDGKRKYVNACRVHFDKTKGVLITMPLFQYLKAKQLFGSIH